MSSLVLQKVFSFILLITLGYLLKTKFKEPISLKTLRTFILSVALPATIFLSTLDVDVKLDLLVFPAYALLINLCLLLVGYLVTRFRFIKLKATQQRMFILLFPSLAPGLTIYPFLEQFNGRDSLAWAAISDVGNKLFVLFGLLILAYAWYQKATGKLTQIKASQSKNLGLTLLCEPINAALLIALFLAKLHFDSHSFPPSVLDVLQKLASTTTPLILIFIGLSIKLKSIEIGRVLLVLALRAGVGLILSLSAIFLLRPTSPDILMLLFAMPQASCSLWPLLHTFQINEHFQSNEDKAIKQTFFDTEFGTNFLAVSFPFSCLVLLVVFSSSHWILALPQMNIQPFF